MGSRRVEYTGDWAIRAGSQEPGRIRLSEAPVFQFCYHVRGKKRVQAPLRIPTLASGRHAGRWDT